jgi:glycosyltransferase involved in cell wall biosynthesis
MSKLALITPTGGRPEAFALCEQFMAQQTFTDWEWIVVDDCKPNVECTLDQRVLHPWPAWEAGMESTQCRNLLLALERASSEFVAVIEDDDYYSPRHLENICKYLETAALVGEIPSRYYNVKHRMFRTMAANQHASLCQTGFRAELIPMVREVCKLNGPVDVCLWQEVRSNGGIFKQYLEDQVIGIKGMPGRAGVGIGHYPESRLSRWNADPQLRVLQDWIGDDAKLYKDYYGPRNSAQNLYIPQPATLLLPRL